jgi:hypothetical protein
MGNLEKLEVVADDSPVGRDFPKSERTKQRSASLP